MNIFFALSFFLSAAFALLIHNKNVRLKCYVVFTCSYNKTTATKLQIDLKTCNFITADTTPLKLPKKIHWKHE